MHKIQITPVGASRRRCPRECRANTTTERPADYYTLALARRSRANLFARQRRPRDRLAVVCETARNSQPVESCSPFSPLHERYADLAYHLKHRSWEIKISGEIKISTTITLARNAKTDEATRGILLFAYITVVPKLRCATLLSSRAPRGYASRYRDTSRSRRLALKHEAVKPSRCSFACVGSPRGQLFSNVRYL